MFVKKISISSFRNLKDQDLVFSKGTNIIIGDNGQGKSNILEAISLTLSGKSFRHSERNHFIQHGTETAFLNTAVSKSGLDYFIKMGITHQKYLIELNNKKASLNELRKRFSVIIFSPDSLTVIKEAASERRDLIDDFIESVSSSFADLMQDYRKLLRQRNQLLKDLNKAPGDRTAHQLLDSTNQIFLPKAVEISVQRIKYIRDFLPQAEIALSDIHQKPIKLGIEYVISDENVFEKTRDFIAEIITKRLSELRDAEIRYGSSLIGPHRHDLKFLFNGNDSRFFCSQGQQRTIILALKMAQIVYHKRITGNYPILILDDVLSELDEMRSGTLINFVQGLGTQIFISSTDVSLPISFSKENTLVSKVENGKVHNLERKS